MHVIHVLALFAVVSLVGVEFSVAAFVNPAARRLDPVPQIQFLSRCAYVLGKVMPVWYPLCAVLFGVETWWFWQTPGRGVLLAADALWLLATLASVLLLVPLNNQVAAGAEGWQQAHAMWDRRHRVRTVVLAVAAVLLVGVVAR